ncbi:MAG: bifunctional phosphoglucose/phosphomannose isomerase [Ignavibacteriales bacterium]|nr:bifunctional phosphoglucose/phosphomannose isomerase [Ignavibacteriales bacterium]
MSITPVKMTFDKIRKSDPADMFRCVVDFPLQVEEALRIGAGASLSVASDSVRSIVLTGMGGSAIAGDLLRSYLAEELRIPFLVNRSYSLPGLVDRNSLVIVSSYSGNTEETIASYRDAIRRKAAVLCITTGGEAERLASKHGHSCIKVPPGLQPRAALGYSFFPLLLALSRMAFIRPRPADISETVAALKKKSQIYADLKSPENNALQMAKRLQGKLPVIYSASDRFDAVNVRWREQICENSKHLAFGHVLPEMNHNEIIGWKVDRELLKKIGVVMLRDVGTHPRVRVREEITKSIIRKKASVVLEAWSEGTSLLARTFSLVYTGDWVSYYLAILNNEDPTPVKVIDYLKGELAKD